MHLTRLAVRYLNVYLQSEHRKPYRNWTRVKCQNYLAEIRFCCLLVRKIRCPLGPIYLVFFAPSAIFSANGTRARPGQKEPCVNVFNLVKAKISLSAEGQTDRLTDMCLK